MSHNIFQIDPIFFMPIDFEDNSKISSETEDDSQNSSGDMEKKKKNNVNKINEDDTSNEYSSSGKDLGQTLDINKQNKEKSNIIVFSTSVNDPHIKSMTNSSKIYTSEIFKQNWKLKSRRLITKLKKKLIKQYKNSCLEENNEKKNNKNNEIVKHNICGNKINNIKNYNNSYMTKCSHIMNNYINNNNICNNFIENNLLHCPNACTNIKINFNQYNNNYNIINNLICNNEVGQFMNLLNM